MPLKTLKICPKGHRFYKSSDCPSCTTCEAENKPETGFLALLSAPARRALQDKGISTLKKLSACSEKELMQLHGFGKASLPILRKVLSEANLNFNK